jgi:hypothetical protein
MSKRRTRKQKERAKHSFNVSWQPTKSKVKPKAKKDVSEAVVKGQTRNFIKGKKHESKRAKKAMVMGNYENLGMIRRNLVKSLVIASLILCLELVLYFRWQ